MPVRGISDGIAAAASPTVHVWENSAKRGEPSYVHMKDEPCLGRVSWRTMLCISTLRILAWLCDCTPAIVWKGCECGSIANSTYHRISILTFQFLSTTADPVALDTANPQPCRATSPSPPPHPPPLPAPLPPLRVPPSPRSDSAPRPALVQDRPYRYRTKMIGRERWTRRLTGRMMRMRRRMRGGRVGGC